MDLFPVKYLIHVKGLFRWIQAEVLQKSIKQCDVLNNIQNKVILFNQAELVSNICENKALSKSLDREDE